MCYILAYRTTNQLPISCSKLSLHYLWSSDLFLIPLGIWGSHIQLMQKKQITLLTICCILAVRFHRIRFKISRELVRLCSICNYLSLACSCGNADAFNS